MLRIQLLGKVNISSFGERIEDKLSNKLIALLSLLFLNKDKNLSKEKIISYLWPDSNEEAAKSNLRFHLWTIKKLIPQSEKGEELILNEKDFCRINQRYPFYCDKSVLDQYRPSGPSNAEELIKLKDLFQGDFLEGLYLKNCDEFNEMILFERVVCQNKQVEILEKLINLYEEQEKYEEGLQILNEVTAIEPYHERFAYQIISMYGKLGNRVAAINYYKKFESALRRNLNISPNKELKLLYGTLLGSSAESSAEPIKNISGIKKKKLLIESHCVPDIEYFWVADVIREVMRAADKKYMLEIPKLYLFDLGYIQRELLIDYEKIISAETELIAFVPAVRILQAFFQFLLHAADLYDLTIRISSSQNMDPVSAQIRKHIEEKNLQGIWFEP
jgi:DNA-binding SARP family transcriptional activator